MDMPGELCKRGGKRGRNIGYGGATEAVAATGEAFIVQLLVMVWRLSVVVCVLLRAGFGGVRVGQMQRGICIATRKGER
jgi:hypothetical protein